MALTSTSTDAEIEAAYDDNADYDAVASVSKVKEFILACRILLRRQLKRAVHGGRGGGQEYERDPQQLRSELNNAMQWLGSAPASEGGGAVTYADFSGKDW